MAVELEAGWVEQERWRGFVPLAPRAWLLDRHFVMSWVAGADRCEAIDDARLNPGEPVAVRPEPENPADPRAMAVWTKDRQLKVGYVPRVIGEGLGHPMATRFGVVLWEEGPVDERSGLGVLLSREEVELLPVDIPATKVRSLITKTNQYRHAPNSAGPDPEVDPVEQMRRMLEGE